MGLIVNGEFLESFFLGLRFMYKFDLHLEDHTPDWLIFFQTLASPAILGLFLHLETAHNSNPIPSIQALLPKAVRICHPPSTPRPCFPVGIWPPGELKLAYRHHGLGNKQGRHLQL